VLARTLGVRDSHAIPVSALEGDNVVTRSSRMPWYDGPTVLGYLESVDDTSLEIGEDFRFPVQSVVRPQSAGQAPWAARAPEVDGDYRGYAGQVASGRITVGDEIVVLPAGTHAAVEAIDTPDGPLEVAAAGQSVVLRLDRDLDVSRGAILTSVDAPPAPTRDLTGTVCWLTDRSLSVGSRVLVQHGTSLTKAVVKQIDGVLDLDFDASAPPTWRTSDTLSLNDIGRIRLALAAPLPVDPYKEHRGTGSFILVDEMDGWTLAAGMAGPSSLHTSAVDPNDTAEPVTT
jgi:sulfate adenylyltransferase subunit 1